MRISDWSSDVCSADLLDVDVDVRRPVALGRQEPLEEQAEADGVGVGDAEGVADGAVGGAPPPLAEDALAAAEVDDVPHHQEVAGEAELLDERQLVPDLAVGARHPPLAPRAVPSLGPPRGEPAQVGPPAGPLGP